jgi:hypothetical protein
VRLVNVSLGGPRDDLLVELLEVAEKRGITVVAAAQKEGADGWLSGKVVLSCADLHIDCVDPHHVRSSQNGGMTQGCPSAVACRLCHGTQGPAVARPYRTHDYLGISIL